MVHEKELKQRVFNEEPGLREPSRDVEVLGDKQQQKTVTAAEPERTQGGSGITRTWRGRAMEEGTSPFSMDNGAAARTAVRQEVGRGHPAPLPSQHAIFCRCRSSQSMGALGGAVCRRKPP